MTAKARAITTDDLAAFEKATASALTIVLGLLAEAVGSQKTAYHLGAALSAAKTKHPDPIRERLLDQAYRLVLVKAMHHAPDDPVLRDLAASVNARKTKH